MRHHVSTLLVVTLLIAFLALPPAVDAAKGLICRKIVCQQTLHEVRNEKTRGPITLSPRTLTMKQLNFSCLDLRVDVNLVGAPRGLGVPRAGGTFTLPFRIDGWARFEEGAGSDRLAVVSYGETSSKMSNGFRLDPKRLRDHRTLTVTGKWIDGKHAVAVLGLGLNASRVFKGRDPLLQTCTFALTFHFDVTAGTSTQVAPGVKIKTPTRVVTRPTKRPTRKVIRPTKRPTRKVTRPTKRPPRPVVIHPIPTQRPPRPVVVKPVPTKIPEPPAPTQRPTAPRQTKEIQVSDLARGYAWDLVPAAPGRKISLGFHSTTPIRQIMRVSIWSKRDDCPGWQRLYQGTPLRTIRPPVTTQGATLLVEIEWTGRLSACRYRLSW